MTHRVTESVFLERLAAENKRVGRRIAYASGTAWSGTNRVVVRCLDCGHEWSPTAQNITEAGQACPACRTSHKRTSKIQSRASLLKSRVARAAGGRYSVIRVVPARRKYRAELSCTTCKHTWSASTDNLLGAKSGCPVCAGRGTWTVDYLQSKASAVRVESVQGKHVHFTCSEHGAQRRLVQSFLASATEKRPVCAACSITAAASKQGALGWDLFSKLIAPYKTLSVRRSDYKGQSNPLRFTCSEHGTHEVSRGQNLLNGPTCCRSRVSRPHNDLIEVLHGLDPNVKIVTNARRVIHPLELDVFLPEYNLAFEVNGIYWHRDRPDYHKNKTSACATAGLRLVHLWDYEITQQRGQVSSLCASLLGKNRRVFARTLQVQQVSDTVAAKFYSLFHMQGTRALTKSAVSFALVDGRSILQMLSVDRPLFDKRADLELVRTSTRAGVTVVGGFSRLLSRVRRAFPGKTLVTYADLRLFTGASYDKAGFTLSHISKPNYWYAHASCPSEPVYSRYAAQKHKLKGLLEGFDPELSEYENMTEHGFVRIFDCGNAVYRITL